MCSVHLCMHIFAYMCPHARRRHRLVSESVPNTVFPTVFTEAGALNKTQSSWPQISFYDVSHTQHFLHYSGWFPVLSAPELKFCMFLQLVWPTVTSLPPISPAMLAPSFYSEDVTDSPSSGLLLPGPWDCAVFQTPKGVSNSFSFNFCSNILLLEGSFLLTDGWLIPVFTSLLLTQCIQTSFSSWDAVAWLLKLNHTL